MIIKISRWQIKIFQGKEHYWLKSITLIETIRESQKNREEIQYKYLNYLKFHKEDLKLIQINNKVNHHFATQFPPLCTGWHTNPLVSDDRLRA